MKLRVFIFQLQRELQTTPVKCRAYCYEDAQELAHSYARDKRARVLFFDKAATAKHPEGDKA